MGIAWAMMVTLGSRKLKMEMKIMNSVRCISLCNSEKRHSWREHTEVVIALHETVECAQDDDDARQGAEAHGYTETDLLPHLQLGLAEDEPGEER